MVLEPNVPCLPVSNHIIGGNMTFEEIRKKTVKITILLVTAVVVLFAGYTAIALNWSYSKGERVGYIQKFSEKGWLCKTWEGELQMLPVPGAMPEKFSFSVREKSLVNKINSGMGKKVVISYEQHKGIPTTCFGESEYFAVDAKISE
jgi:hypothetical protein